MSIYLIALERDLDQRGIFGKLTVGLLRRVEWLALRLPDRLIHDTAVYSAWLGKIHGVSSERFRLVPTGADDRIFHPLDTEHPEDGIFRVVYYGTYIPNHGVGHIVAAARRLSAETDIRFEMIGNGPEQSTSKEIAKGLENITFIDWLEKPVLIEHISRADICLGAFGTTPQSVMTVQNKIYEGLAMGKAVITGDSEAMQQDFIHKEHLYLCARANGVALAEAIRTLRNDPPLRQKLAQNGYQIFRDHFDLAHNGQRYAGHLAELIKPVGQSGR